MGEYIDVPKNLDRRALESLFGYEAVTFYLNRIAQRQREGMVYKNPYKTVFLWATKDKKTNQGFYSSYRGYSRGRKHKNYGGS